MTNFHDKPTRRYTQQCRYPMDKSSIQFRKKARAFTGIDAAGQGPVLSTNKRGLPTHGRRRDVSKRVRSNNNEACEKIRIASLNIGMLTGKPEELAEMLRRRRIDICTLQETRWSGAKACPGSQCSYRLFPKTAF